jgi:hypothetical protein
LDIKYNDDSNDKQKKNIRLQQKQFRAQLRDNIIGSFLADNSPSPDSRQVAFDIPGTDYSVRFNNISSRKTMYPGYIHHYSYLGPQTVVSSGVTGVTTGVPHRHYKSVIRSLIKNTIGAGISAVGIRFLLKRIVLPPIYTAAITALLVVYSLRDIIAGHFRYSSDHHQHTKALQKEFSIEQQLYSTPSTAQVRQEAGQNAATADIIRDAWEFQPFEGFYTNNNWKSDNIWSAINQGPASAYRSQQATQRQKKQEDEKYQDMKRKAEEAEKMRNMPPVIPTDPYLLIMGEDYLGLPKSTPNNPTQPTLRLNQVSQIPFDVLKAKYFEQIKYWHPDTHTDQSPEYASERTRLLVEAWGKVSNKVKKDQFDRQFYR